MNKSIFDGYRVSIETLKKTPCRNHMEFYPKDFWEKSSKGWCFFLKHLIYEKQVFLENEELEQLFSSKNIYINELYRIVLHDMVQWFFDGERNPAVKELSTAEVFSMVRDLVVCMTAVADELTAKNPDDPFGFKKPEVVQNNPGKTSQSIWEETPFLKKGIVISDHSDSYKYLAFLNEEGLVIEKFRESCLKESVLNFLDTL